MELLSAFHVSFCLYVLCWELSVGYSDGERVSASKGLQMWYGKGEGGDCSGGKWLQSQKNIPKEEVQRKSCSIPSGEGDGSSVRAMSCGPRGDDIWTGSWRIASISMGMGEGHGRKCWMSSSHQREAWGVSGEDRRSALTLTSQQVTGDEAGEVGLGCTVY